MVAGADWAARGWAAKGLAPNNGLVPQSDRRDKLKRRTKSKKSAGKSGRFFVCAREFAIIKAKVANQ